MGAVGFYARGSLHYGTTPIVGTGALYWPTE